MKKKFYKPTVKAIVFCSADIITTSGEINDGGNDTNNGTRVPIDLTGKVDFTD